MRAASPWLAVALTVTAIGVAGCGGDDDEDDGGTTAADEQGATTAGEAGDEILIKTHLTIPTGEVLPGSTIGDSAFCEGGTFRDSGGGTEIFKAFGCPDGRVTISFSPGQLQRQGGGGTVQRGPWEVTAGSGAYEGLRGGGEMKVEFPNEDSNEGRETFTGTVAE